MYKDFKIGIIIGIVAAAAVAVWLSTRQNLSTESRALKKASKPAAAAPASAAPSTPAAPVFPAAPAPSPVAPEPKIAKPPPQPQPSPQTKPARYYVVRKGDTLSAVSQKYYGTPNRWSKIFSANRNVLDNPDRLIPGTRLVIPE